eukprot:CAMPEP_0184536104 /NCGR_PEP_ID=MMETSP0198_2-20121128/16246_1 /TAXON_ID=1112570 /ORGANISM="Thraustochytrium sp., Strain LLF1b" /LENGTH=1144 /DNA_ID=CAMNT_0026929193 /DNA_START=1036 /DNA_END=4471 /DNA_ORIENTATION=+
MGEAVYGAFEAEKFAQPVGEVICAPHAIKTVTGYFEFEDVDNSGFAKVNFDQEANRVAMDATQRSVYSELHARRYVPTEVLEYYSLLRNRGDMRDWASEVRNVSVLFIHLGLNVVNVNLSHPDTVNLSQPDTESIQHLNTAVYEVQQAVVNYDGFINKVNLDDKGITAIAVFGLAPKSHENDATRAVLAALRIVAVVEEKIGAEVSVGITSNLCFCGVVGHRSGRKEYTVIGDAVNLAARLMQTAKADQLSRILTDVRTYMLVGEEVAFAKTAREIKVKGKLARIKVFSPSVKGHFGVVRRWRSSSIDCKARRSIGGAVSNDWKHAWESQVSRYGAQRLHDMRDFYQPLQRVSSDHLASPNSLAKRLPRKGAAVTMITGDIGSGRTHVLSLVWHRLTLRSDTMVLVAAANPFQGPNHMPQLEVQVTLRCDTMVLVAAANPFQGPNHVPSWKFRVWVRLIECAMASKEDVAPSSTNCEICADPFDSTNQQLTQRRQALLSSWLAQAPEAATLLTDKWVLNDLFGVHFPKHSESKFESEPHEIDTLRIHMLVTLLRGIACKEQVNVVCLIDDTDSIPDLAWDVATKLAESHTLKDGVSVILTCERRKGKMPGHKAARALAQKNFSTVDVETVPQLGRVQLESLARNHLGVLSIPDDLADMVELLSHGNPLLAQSLVDELQKLELLVVDRENLLCKWAPKAKRRRSTSDARKTRTIFACTVENLLKDVPSKSPWTSPVETFKKSLRGSHYEDRAKGLPRTASTSVLASARKVSGHKLPSAFKLLLNEAVRPDKKFMERSKHSEHSTHKNDSPKFEVRRYSAAVYLNELTALTIEPPLIYNVVYGAWLNDFYGAWLNELSFRELLLLKIASMAVINSTATFRKVPVVQAALIIMPTATAARIEEDLVRLTKSRLLTTANDDTSARNAAQFTFVHWLMPRVLRLRTLESQRAEILRCLDESSRHYEAGIRRVFLDRVHGWMDLNTPIKHGQVYIHKQLSGTSAKWSGGRLINRRHSVGSSWKRRFATLYPDRIVLFRDAGCLRKAGVIFLSDAEIQFEEAGFGGHSFVFKIDAQRWMKHKNSSRFEHARSFYFNPVENTRDGVDDWIFKVRLAIESTKKGLPFCEEKGDVPRMRRYTVASAVPLTFLAA